MSGVGWRARSNSGGHLSHQIRIDRSPIGGVRAKPAPGWFEDGPKRRRLELITTRAGLRLHP
jgi:hypothetical protein